MAQREQRNALTGIIYSETNRWDTNWHNLKHFAELLAQLAEVRNLEGMIGNRLKIEGGLCQLLGQLPGRFHKSWAVLMVLYLDSNAYKQPRPEWISLTKSGASSNKITITKVLNGNAHL